MRGCEELSPVYIGCAVGNISSYVHMPCSYVPVRLEILATPSSQSDKADLHSCCSMRMTTMLGTYRTLRPSS